MFAAVVTHPAELAAHIREVLLLRRIRPPRQLHVHPRHPRRILPAAGHTDYFFTEQVAAGLNPGG